jgi:hypothetical protein
MNKKLLAIYSLIVLTIIGLVFFVQLQKTDIFLHFLDTNLPFREAYKPNLDGLIFLYLFPLIEGFALSRIFSSYRIKNSFYFINLALFFGIISAVPVLLRSPDLSTYWYRVNSVAYFFIMQPVLLMLGMLPTLFRSSVSYSVELRESNKINQSIRLKDVSVAVIFGSVLFILNLIPMMLSRYLVGADVYYHAAKTQTISNGESIFTNPFFLNANNYYYSIVYYILSYASRLTNLSLNTIWFLYVPVCSFFIGVIFYLFSRNVTRSVISASISTAAMVLLSQFLWVDPSVRTLSYLFSAGFFLFFVWFISSGKKYLFIPVGLLWILAIATHPEIAIHMTVISLVYVVLSLIIKLDSFKDFIDVITEHVIRKGVYFQQLDKPVVLIILLVTTLLLLCQFIIFALQNYPVTQNLNFNEIPLSLFMPVGIISIVVFLFAISGIPQLVSRIHNRLDRFILSILSLALTGVFYFTLLWQLYHRYFFETAYFALALIAGITIYKVFLLMNKKLKFAFFLVLASFVLLSIVPRVKFIYTYSRATDNSLAQRQTDFELIKNNSLQNDIIMINPENIINRYIPFYGERRIMAGSSIISKDQQWQVLSFCNGPFSSACDPRDKISSEFFTSPNWNKLMEIISSYKVDYLLITKLQSKELDSFTNSNLNNLKPVAENEHYRMYDLKELTQ